VSPVRVPPAVVALVLVAIGTAAQTPVRRVTSIDALRQFPGYFHLENVLLHGEFAESGNRVLLRGGEREIRVLLNEERSRTGLVEVRGVLFDIGRMEPGDPRLARYSDASPDQWPRPGEELVLSVTGVAEAQLATTPSVRALALQPWRFEGQKVSLLGQFRGRNLFGDLPSAPGTSRYDFVLRSADAAVWVTGLRPRGKGFDLSVDARVDTGRWLEVTGTVSSQRGLVTVEAATLVAAAAPEAPPPVSDEPLPAAPPAEPVEVVFSSPNDGEVDVALTSSVRVQFSRGLDPASLAGQIRVSYVGTAAPDVGTAPKAEFQHTYDAGTRAIEIKFTQPLERFRTVRVELLEGIKGFDGAPFTPWTMTFSVGG
jgi:hypothetical protein